MKQKLVYFIPTVLATVIFVTLYSGEVKKKRAKEDEHTAQVEAKKSADNKKKKDDDAFNLAAMQEKARQKRDAEDKARRDKEEKIAADKREILKETTESMSIVNAKTREIAALEAAVKSLHTQKDELNRAYILASKDVQGLNAQKTVADLQVERGLAMIQDQAEKGTVYSFPMSWFPDPKSGYTGIPPQGFPPVKGQK